MILSYYLLPEPICLEETSIPVLIVENGTEYRRIVNTIREQINGFGGDFVLSEKNEPIEFKSVELVTDVFSLDFESRRLQTKMTQMAAENARQFSDEFSDVFRKLNELAFKISSMMNIETTYTELETADALIKQMNFRLDTEALSFPEKVLEYAILQRDIFGKRLIVFLNLKACMSDEELESLYRNLVYEKIPVLLLETSQMAAVSNEKTIIIDKDLCVIK